VRRSRDGGGGYIMTIVIIKNHYSPLFGLILDENIILSKWLDKNGQRKLTKILESFDVRGGK
jgi:hypothetical protein